MAVALRTEVFLVGAFSSAGTAGEIGASLAGSALASALGAAALVVVFLAVVVERLRVVVLAAGFARQLPWPWLGGRLLDLVGGLCSSFGVVFAAASS